MRAVLDDQPFDQVKAVQFGVVRHHGWQIPAPRGWRASHPPLTIEGSAALQDASDGPQGGHGRDLVGLQFPLDGYGAILSQVARFLEVAPQGQDAVFERGGRPPGPMGCRRPVAPVHPRQALPCGPAHPALHGGQADAKAARHRPQRLPASHGAHHGLSLLLATGEDGCSCTMVGAPSLPFPGGDGPHQTDASDIEVLTLG